MNFRPLHDRLLVKRLEANTTSAGGIVIPDAHADKSTQGEVLAVGPGAPLDNGELRPLTVNVGDRVLFGEYSGTEVKVDGEKYLIIRETDVFAVIEETALEEKAA